MSRQPIFCFLLYRSEADSGTQKKGFVHLFQNPGTAYMKEKHHSNSFITCHCHSSRKFGFVPIIKEEVDSRPLQSSPHKLSLTEVSTVQTIKTLLHGNTNGQVDTNSDDGGTKSQIDTKPH